MEKNTYKKLLTRAKKGDNIIKDRAKMKNKNSHFKVCLKDKKYILKNKKNFLKKY